ncbi:MAG: 3'-5' exonuclease [bacterium]|nr:3'-5' exonuclease [bacterium]
MDKIFLNKKCPECKNNSSITIEKNNIFCTEQACSFTTFYCCPVCDKILESSNFKHDDKGEFFVCSGCNNKVHTKKIQYLIESGLIVDKKQRCSFCNNPTIHRKEINMSNRCFFFPKCSGQADLFGSSKESLIFLDFETTGLDHTKGSIIEMGAIKIDEDGYEHIFQTFCSINGDLDPRITSITGITNEMLKDAPDIKSSLSKLIVFIGSGKIIAHNADFDIPWLIVNSILHKIPVQNNSVICTLKWAKLYNEPRCSLGALTRKYAIGHQNAHRALADATATKELFFIFDNKKTVPRPSSKLNNYMSLSKKITTKYHEKKADVF